MLHTSSKREDHDHDIVCCDHNLLVFRVMAKYASQHFKQRLMSWVSLFLVGVFMLVLVGIFTRISAGFNTYYISYVLIIW